MDANVTPQVEAKPFEPMTIYYDPKDQVLHSGFHLNELASRATDGDKEAASHLRGVFRNASPKESLAYWAAVAVQLENERLDFESRMAQLTGHYVEVRLDVHLHASGNYTLFEAAKVTDGYKLDGNGGSQWVKTNEIFHGHVAIFGPYDREKAE